MQVNYVCMASVNINEEMPNFSFSGKSHRIFIDGRGFDFKSFDVWVKNKYVLKVKKINCQHSISSTAP